MDQEKLKTYIDGAYNMIANIPVKGVDAKRMAMAMQHLENAFAELSKAEKEETDG